MTINKKLYHYTVGARIGIITESGQINVATAYVSKNESPAVWCTYNQDWEETANKRIKDARGIIKNLNREETHKEAGGLFRIEVLPEAVPYTWNQFKKISGISKKIAKALEQIANEVGSNTNDWRVGLDPIHATKWVSIGKWDGNKWVIVWDISTSR